MEWEWVCKPCKGVNSFPYIWYVGELLELGTFDFCWGMQGVSLFPTPWYGSELWEANLVSALTLFHTNGMVVNYWNLVLLIAVREAHLQGVSSFPCHGVGLRNGSKPCKSINSFPHKWHGSELLELGTFDCCEGRHTLQGG